MAVAWQAVIVGVLAGLVGLAEILTRYRSDPGYALRSSPSAWLYVSVNAIAGVAALLLVRSFGWNFGQTEHTDLWRILVAGFGAIALFRSSLFMTKVGGSSVGVGPSLVLGAILDTFDREVDRDSAKEMAKIMTASQLGDLDPERVMTALPVLCLALMQNFPASDQALLGTELMKTRHDKELTPEAKMRATVIQLAKYLGSDLVKCVLENAGDVLKDGTPDHDPLLELAKALTAQEKGQEAT